MSESASPFQDVIKLLRFVFLVLLCRFQVPPQEPLVLGLHAGSFFDGAGKRFLRGSGQRRCLSLLADCSHVEETLIIPE